MISNIIPGKTKIRNKTSGDIYIIEKIHRQHEYTGEVITLLLKVLDFNTHSFIYWENINCNHDIILKMIKKHRETFEIVEDESV